jgi:hypothetical protein
MVKLSECQVITLNTLKARNFAGFYCQDKNQCFELV